MMILYLQCGLGNQMFQYAYIKYLESKGYKNIWIDYSAPSMRKHNGFELRKIFPNIQRRGRFMPYFAGRTLHLLSDISKKGFGYSLETEETGKLWLRGYWQQSSYADSVRDQLISDFDFNMIDDSQNKALLQQIDSCESISIHIRRGDYLSAGERTVFGDICNIEYYKKAIEFIRDRVSKPVFFIFSNDMEWVNSNLDIPNAILVSNNKGANSFKDMQLMSRCRHNIIANSSFSWWGAWLNTNALKKVVAPAKWFHNYPSDFTDKIIPCDWHRIGESHCNLSLIVDFDISDHELNAIKSQSYTDLELIKSGDTAKGNHTLKLKKDELINFSDRKYLENKLVAYFKTI